MIYMDVELNEWCKKHSLCVESMECNGCKKSFKTIVPIIIRGYAGLEIESHECAPNFYGAVFKPTSKDEVDFWNGNNRFDD